MDREPEDEQDADRFAEGGTDEPKDAEAKEEGSAQARKGPRRRGRRGGRRGRQGQGSPRTPGEEAPAEGEGRQNGARRKPRSEQAPEKEIAKPSHREAERVFETVARVSEQPAPAVETHVEVQSEPDAPRRKGWWSR